MDCYESFVLYIFFVSVISTSTHRCENNISHDINVLMMFIKTETFNGGFT